MANCPNCKSRITCGCQRRTASDGAAVCTKCSRGYENILRDKKRAKPKATAQPATNVSARYYKR